MRLEFDWDPEKASSNRAKHGVSFEEAMMFFQDPMALSVIDRDHVGLEERWVTLGGVGGTRPPLVVHTFDEIGDDVVAIRIISARRPTRREIRQYEEG